MSCNFDIPNVIQKYLEALQPTVHKGIGVGVLKAP